MPMSNASPTVLKTQSFTHQWVAFAIMVLFFVIAPIWIYPIFLMKVMCFALFACAFNLLLGFGGLLSFGHAMFLGTAGYAAAHAAKVWGWNPELTVLFATACSALLALLTGLLAIRRQGIYFAMITLAFSQMVFFFYLQTPFTGGEDGIQSVPRGKLDHGRRTAEARSWLLGRRTWPRNRIQSACVPASGWHASRHRRHRVWASAQTEPNLRTDRHRILKSNG